MIMVGRNDFAKVIIMLSPAEVKNVMLHMDSSLSKIDLLFKNETLNNEIMKHVF